MTLRLAMITLAVAAGATLHAQSPALQDVLTRAAEYHATYVKAVSGVSLEEQVQLMNVSGGTTRSIVRISADVVLVNVSGDVEALRDVYAIDTRPTRERTPRILQLLGAPAKPTIKDWQTAITYPGQEAVYFLLDIVVKTNEPTTALQFVSAANQPTLQYKLEGRKTMNNVAVVGVQFEEPESRDRKYLLGTRSNGRARGRLWIDPLTGAIHQTELWVDSRQERTYSEHATVTVKFAPHEALGWLLPSEMTASHEEFDASGMRRSQMSANAGADVDGRITLQSRTQYTNATFAAIDLTKFAR